MLKFFDMTNFSKTLRDHLISNIGNTVCLLLALFFISDKIWKELNDNLAFELNFSYK